MPKIEFEAESQAELMQMVQAFWYGSAGGQRDLIMIGKFQAWQKGQETASKADETPVAQTDEADAGGEDAKPKEERARKPKRKSAKKKTTKKAAEEKEEEQTDDQDAEDAADDAGEDDAGKNNTNKNNAEAGPLDLDTTREVLGVISQHVPGKALIDEMKVFCPDGEQVKLSNVPEDKRVEFLKKLVSVAPEDKQEMLQQAISDAGVKF